MYAQPADGNQFFNRAASVPAKTDIDFSEPHEFKQQLAPRKKVHEHVDQIIQHRKNVNQSFDDLMGEDTE